MEDLGGSSIVAEAMELTSKPPKLGVAGGVESLRLYLLNFFLLDLEMDKDLEVLEINGSVSP